MPCRQYQSPKARQRNKKAAAHPRWRRPPRTPWQTADFCSCINQPARGCEAMKERALTLRGKGRRKTHRTNHVLRVSLSSQKPVTKPRECTIVDRDCKPIPRAHLHASGCRATPSPWLSWRAAMSHARSCQIIPATQSCNSMWDVIFWEHPCALLLQITRPRSPSPAA